MYFKAPLLAACMLQAFGSAYAGTLNKTGRDLTMNMPLQAEGRQLGDLLMQLSADDQIKLQSSRFLEIMEPHVSEKHLDKLDTLLGKQDFFSWYVLGAMGYSISYNQAELRLTLHLPPELRASTRIGGPRTRPFRSTAKLPEDTSAYVNLRAGLNQTKTGSVDTESKQIDMDGAITIPTLGNTTLENESTLNDNDKLVRRGTRIVIDDTTKNRRWQLGDIASANASYMGSENIAGVSLTSNRSTFKPSTNRITGRTSFFIERASTVRIFVNGVLETTLRLDPGPYELEDLAVDYGSNRINVEIEDDTGLVELIAFDLFSDSNFLDQGITELSATAGVTRETSGGKIDYSEKAIAAAQYRKGMSDSLTVGGFAKLKEDINLIGAEVLVAVPGGRLSAESAATKDNEGGEAEFAVNAGLTHDFPYDQSKQAKRLFIGGEFTSNRFNTALSDIPQSKRYSARANYSQTLNANWRMSADAEYQDNRDGPHSENYGVRVGYGLGKVNVSLDVDHSKGNNEDTRALIRVSNRIDRYSSISASVDSDQQADASYRLNSRKRGVGAWGVNASTDYDGETDESSAILSANYTANRAELSASHGRDLSTGTGSRTSVSNVNVNTAIAYSGGKVAIGRPINDSFMILSTHENLEDRKVYSQEGNSYVEASSGALGPALINNLTSYREGNIAYDVEDLPMGYNLGTGAETVFPSYRSGYQTTVGSSGTVTAIGTLIDKQGEPIQLLVGMAKPIDAATNEPVQLFTNSTGRFSAQGLSPGSWEVVVKGKHSSLTYRLQVPQGTVGLWRAGTLNPQV